VHLLLLLKKLVNDLVVKSEKGISTMIALVGIMGFLIVGLGIGYYLNLGQTETAVDFPEDSEWRTDAINLAGSTTVLPVTGEAAKALMNKYSLGALY
jgi:ABC-type phosphate transport system substrate-binding protein